jgi:hypothetical protein
MVAADQLRFFSGYLLVRKQGVALPDLVILSRQHCRC